MNSPFREKRERLTKYFQKQIPGFEILSKKKSPLMRAISKILFFNKKFLTSYVTTLYPKDNSMILNTFPTLIHTSKVFPGCYEHIFGGELPQKSLEKA